MTLATDAPAPAAMPVSPASDLLLTPSERAELRRRLRHARFKEWCLFDSSLARWTAARAQHVKALLHHARGRTLAGLQTWTRLHRAALSPRIDGKIEARLHRWAAEGRLQPLLQEHISSLPAVGRSADIFRKPHKVFDGHATVLKAASEREKGVLLLNYSYIYAPFARMFDLLRIAERYYIALEPSWSGTCDENILAYAFLPTPVFVQSSEPRDIEFLRRFPGNLLPVPTAANWWVDHNLYRPLPDVAKDADLVMVSAWGEFKRHYAVFDVLARLRRRGRRLRALLAGYPADLTLADIDRLARFYGVRDQIEMHEWLPPQEVNRLMNRARVNVLWSRREGFNRSVIEGLFANVPFIMRAGFNYGHHHDYVNDQTGRFVGEADLSDALLEMIDRPGPFAPRAWALAHMTYHHATALLEDHMKAEAARRGDPWTGSLVGHMSGLHGNMYLNPEDHERFRADYEFLAGCLRPSVPSPA